MRTCILLSFMILITLPCHSQTDDSIVDLSKVWYTHIYIYCCWQVDTEVIGLSQDTTINDTNYNKVLRSTGGNINPSQYYGFIREDSLHRIYYKTTATNPERLIYDFSITEKDTITAYGLMKKENDEFSKCQYICDSISIREYHGVQRRVFYLTELKGLVPEYWIEGLGSSSGLLHNFDGRVGGDAFYLSCVYSGDSLLFKKYATCVRIALDINDITPRIE